MTGWMQIPKGSIEPMPEFTAFGKMSGEPTFRPLAISVSKVSSRSKDAEEVRETNLAEKEAKAFDNSGAAPMVEQETDEKQHTDTEALEAEIARLKNAHNAEIIAVEEKLVAGMAASILSQHRAAVDELMETVARCTADVLRPILGDFATRAAVKDLKDAVGDLLINANPAEFSVHVSRTHHELFRRVLPAEIEIVPSQISEPAIKITLKETVISSCLTKWSQSIMGHISSE